MKRRKSRTNVNGSSGRPKNKSLESVDRISVLPDSILGIILSFLPTKNAVSTAVLSKRWKLVWTTVHNLDLCYEVSRAKQGERDDMRFVGFVNRVLLHHDAGRLNKFRLVWTPRCISSHATSWICTAIAKNVHELSLRLETHTLFVTDYSIYRESPEPFVMPICVFSCNTLRFLELDGISISAEIVVCLPKLETIKLDSVYFQSEEAFENLIRGCPVLINLFISMRDDMLFEFRQDDDFTYIISSTSLRLVEILNEYETDDEAFYINLELEASSLEYLTLVGVVLIPVFSVQKSLSSLVEAKFDVYLGESILSNADICNSVVEAVRVLDCAKALILTADIIWALNCATISLSTEFKRLVKLEIETYCWACSSLRDLIQCSDNLEVLTIDQDPMDDEDEHGDEDEYDDDHSNWTTLVEVPRCLSTSLKKVVLNGYNGNEDEHEMICYLLKHGSALEVMQIYCDIMLENEKLDLVQEIREFPRKSHACDVKIFRCNHPCHGQ